MLSQNRECCYQLASQKVIKSYAIVRILFYPIANHLKDTTPFTRPSAINAAGGDTDQKLLSEGIQ